MNEIDTQPFPFSGALALKDACATGKCQIYVSPAMIPKWASGCTGKNPTFFVQVRYWLNEYLYLAASLAMSVYAFLTDQPLLLSVIPLMMLIRLALSPIAANPNPYLRLLVIATLLTGLLGAILSADTQRSLIMSCLVLSWISQRAAFAVASKSFFRNLFIDDEFCRDNWHEGTFTIQFLEDRLGSEFEQDFVTPSNVSGMQVSPKLTSEGNIELVYEQPSALMDVTKVPADAIDPETAQAVDRKAMDIVMQYERKQMREPEDVSMFYVGYDIKSHAEKNTSSRVIEVKGKVAPGPIILAANEWTTARALGEAYFLYIVESVYDKEPKIKIIKNPASKLKPVTQRQQYRVRRQTYMTKSEIVDPVH